MIMLKELDVYTLQDLKVKFEMDDTTLNSVIRDLYKEKIIKYTIENNFIFVYVGIIIIKDKVIFVLPKYTTCKNMEEEILVVKNILKLFDNFIKRENLYNSKIKDIDFEIASLENNLISIIKFLLEDYIENGIYQNEKKGIEFNGDGDINWSLTIDKIQPILIQNQWIYTDFYTNMNKVADVRYITLLHLKIINECINFINENGLNKVFGYNLNSITQEIYDIENIDKIVYEINKELRVQFIDRKRKVLQAMQAYILGKSGVNNTGILLYGTRNFKWIWEVICGYVFDNKFVAENGISKYEIFKINSPRWNIDNNDIIEEKNQSDIQMRRNRLTPDIISLFNINEEKYMLILDAKYYKLIFRNGKIQGHPGVSDISKQYLYEMCLKEYIKHNNIDKVFNAFLFPNYSRTYLQGEVSLDFMKNYNVKNIKLIQLEVSEIIELYCSYSKYDIQKILSILNKK